MNRCRLRPAAELPDPDLVRRLQALPTAVLSDQMERGGGIAGLAPLPGTALERHLAGPALTVRTRPGDNLVVHKAIDLAREGEVLVVDAGGATDRAVMGEIVYRHAVSRGIAGVVIDGALRDARDIAAGPVPVFAKGANHQGPYKSGPGDIRFPVSVGGTVVRDGDIVVGDGDGLVVVPRDRAAAVAAGGEAAFEKETAQLEAATAGTLDRSWLDTALEVELVDPE